MTDTTKLRELLAAATPGPWEPFNMVHADTGEQMTPEEIGEYVCNAVKQGDPSRFLFISGKHPDGGNADICHIGNGPKGPYNSHLIVALRNEAEALLDRLEAAEEQNVREAVAAHEWKQRAEAAEAVVERVRAIITPELNNPDDDIADYADWTPEDAESSGFATGRGLLAHEILAAIEQEAKP